MPYVNQAYANEAIAKGGVQVHDETIFRCLPATRLDRHTRLFPLGTGPPTGSRTGRVIS